MGRKDSAFFGFVVVMGMIAGFLGMLLIAMNPDGGPNATAGVVTLIAGIAIAGLGCVGSVGADR